VSQQERAQQAVEDQHEDGGPEPDSAADLNDHVQLDDGDDDEGD
jgi:hypothetical protein